MNIIRELNIYDILDKEEDINLYSEVYSLLDGLKYHKREGNYFLLDKNNNIQFEIGGIYLYINQPLYDKISHILIKYHNPDVVHLIKKILSLKYNVDEKLFLISHRYCK